MKVYDGYIKHILNEAPKKLDKSFIKIIVISPDMEIMARQKYAYGIRSGRIMLEIDKTAPKGTCFDKYQFCKLSKVKKRKL